MKKIEIYNLKQQYTYGAVGIQDLSLECGAGQIISILSDAEGGKTSLLKTIAGLNTAIEGKIFVDGKDITNNKPKDRDVLLVHEDGGFFNRRSVYYNLGFPLKIRKVSNDQIAYSIKKVANRLGIEDILAKKIKMLNGCQKVKVMIARTLLRKAAVYLLDDPFKMAEPSQRQALFIELLPFIKELQGAVVFATTSVDEARTVSQKTIILNYGYTVDQGLFDEIINKPSCYKSYSFLKGYAVNSIITQIKEKEQSVYVEILGMNIELSKQKLINQIYIGSDIIACFTTKVSQQGIKADEAFFEYNNDKIILHSLIKDKSIKTIINNNQLPSFIDIDLTSIKLFDINSERLVYFG